MQELRGALADAVAGAGSDPSHPIVDNLVDVAEAAAKAWLWKLVNGWIGAGKTKVGLLFGIKLDFSGKLRELLERAIGPEPLGLGRVSPVA